MLGFAQSLFLVILTVNSDYSEWSKLSGNENCGLEEWGAACLAVSVVLPSNKITIMEARTLIVVILQTSSVYNRDQIFGIWTENDCNPAAVHTK
jgi:hypothetical protein